MNLKRKKPIFEIIFIIMLGLIPLLWFHGREVILGHDAGLSISLTPHFLDRLFLWTERYGLGIDQSYAFAGFFIHGFEALIGLLNFDLQTSQKLIFIFWFLLPGITMYLFASKIARDYKLKYFSLPVTVFYMVNHFLLQGWFIAERTKFSLYAALPLIMLLLFTWKEGKLSTLKTSIYISIILFFLNGGGFLPLYGALFLCISVFFAFYLIEYTSLKSVLRIFKITTLTVFQSILIQMYWILPYGSYVFSSYATEVEKAGGQTGVLGWIEYVSRDSSIINILRLQGIPEWYQNPLHPYASSYLHNPILVGIGFLIPIFAFTSLIMAKQKEHKRILLFFALLSVVSIIFIAGSHPPFGSLYIFLINNIPGFIAFRTPYYKFAPALWFAYSVLIGFFIQYILEKYSLKIKNKSLYLYFAVSLGIVIYSYPFITGSFFDYIQGQRSMRVNLPDYILDFGKWSEQEKNLNKKTVLLPPTSGNVDTYTWGYWSLAPLTTLFTNAPIINHVGTTDIEDIILKEMYKDMKNNDPKWKNTADFLGVKSFVVRKDFAWDSQGSLTDNPQEYIKALEDNDVSLVKKFGQWDVYQLNDDVKETVSVSNYLNYLSAPQESLGLVSSFPIFDRQTPFYLENSEKNFIDPSTIKMIKNYYIYPECIACNLQKPGINYDKYVPLLTRGSMLYPYILFNKKNEEKKYAELPLEDRINYYLEDSLQNIFTLRKIREEKRGLSVVIATLNDYLSSIENLKSSSEEYTNKNSNLDQSLMLDIRNKLEIQRTLFVNLSQGISMTDNHLVDLVNSIYSQIIDSTNLINENIWATKDEDNKRYSLYSPIDSEYALLYRPNQNIEVSNNILRLRLNNSNLNLPLKKTNFDWFDAGSIYLEKGFHKIEIETQDINLYNGSPSAILKSHENGSCFFSNGIKAVRGEVFRTTLKHRVLNGHQKFYLRIVTSKENDNIFDNNGDILNSNFFWENYLKDYTAVLDKETIYLKICSLPDIDPINTTNIELKDIKIKKLVVPDLFLYKEKEDVIVEGDLASWRRINQTMYKVDLNNLSTDNKVIMLNSSNNKNWQIDTSVIKQFKANGYANGWIISPKEKSFEIIYKPQKLVPYGFAISFATLILYISYILLTRKK